MLANAAISTLLINACPSIRYRLRSDLLDESPQDPEMEALQVLILKEPSAGRLWRTDVGARLAVGCPLCLRPRLSQLVDSALRRDNRQSKFLPFSSFTS
jgi:hypothetical protein